jgi:phage recombination protein Bet
MTTTLAAAIPQAIALTFTRDQRDLIKRTVAPDATDDELAMFLHVAAKSGLDPLQRQIWFVKRKQNVGTKDNPRWEDRVTIQAGVGGLEARAAREPDYEGMTYGVVCAKDDFQFDATTSMVTKHTYNPFADRGAIMGAWCIVRRRGMLPFPAMVRFSEYNDERSFLWKGKPAVMIEKVARSTALRRAYPEALSGIYAPEELGDKGHDINAPAVVESPPVIPSRAAEAKRLEAAKQEDPDQMVETPPAAAPTPAWDALYARLDATRPDTAGEEWTEATKAVGNGKFIPGRKLTSSQLADMERILFPEPQP